MTTSAKAETTKCTEISAIPFVITAPGIYCLERNRGSRVPSGHAIEIRASHVTIDLNGFLLNGRGAGAGTSANGIFAVDRKNITIRNGTIRGFSRGVFFDQSLAGTSSGHLVEDLFLEKNRFAGAEVRGSGNGIRNNRVVNTGSGSDSIQATGILVQDADNTVIADNVISGTSETNVARGIFVNVSALIEVRGNTVLDTKNATTGIYGIELVVITDGIVIGNRILNAAAAPGTAGIIDSGGSTGINCIDNTVFGFTTALSGCTFEAGTNPPQP